MRKSRSWSRQSRLTLTAVFSGVANQMTIRREGVHCFHKFLQYPNFPISFEIGRMHLFLSAVFRVPNTKDFGKGDFVRISLLNTCLGIQRARLNAMEECDMYVS